MDLLYNHQKTDNFMVTPKQKITSRQLQRINMRNVTHLLAVEFLHNLYNRHIPRINSIRFRNTITVWKDGKANSYAPKSEWETLNRWVGERFIRCEKRFLDEINVMLNREMSFLNSFLAHLDTIDYTKLSNIDLALTLIDLQDFVLGEIYQLNVVQLEYALTNALQLQLKKHEPNASKRTKLLSQIITTNILTESQIEQMEFRKIINFGKKLSIANPNESKQVLRKITKHHNHYAYMHCAYGEEPNAIDFYIQKYVNEYKSQKKGSIQQQKHNIRQQYLDGRNILKSLNDPILNQLAPLMARIGVFRDHNKALLGYTVKHRFTILNEIARRKLEHRNNLDYYLLSEILRLLDNGIMLPKKVINNRKKKGVTLSRLEYLIDETHKITQTTEISHQKIIKGACASSGKVTGTCKIVIDKNDARKIIEGDIMVAVGTDFDLLEAMHLSSGVITEEGGLLSHASVVCREIKKPCLINVKNATRIFKDNMRLEMDATNGEIIIL